MRRNARRNRGGQQRHARERGYPTRLTSLGIGLWVRGSRGITIATGISVWADQGSGGHNLTQGTGANQPTAISSGTVTAQPTVRCNGTTQLMQTAGFTLNSPFTILTTLKIIVAGGAGANDGVFDGLTASTQVSSDAPDKFFIFGGAGPLFVGSNPSTGVFHFMGLVFNGASSAIYVDGTQAASGNAGTNNAGGFTVGALRDTSRPSNTEYEEVLVVQAAVSDSMRQRWQNGARARCGI